MSQSPIVPNWQNQRILARLVKERCRELKLRLIDFAIELELTAECLRALQDQKVTSAFADDCLKICFGGGIPFANPISLFQMSFDVNGWISEHAGYIDAKTRRMGELYRKNHPEPHVRAWKYWVVVIGLMIEGIIQLYWSSLNWYGYAYATIIFLMTSWTFGDIIGYWKFRWREKRYRSRVRGGAM